MKALELADAYADAVSTHRLENLYGTSKSCTLEKAKERDEAHEALATELRRLAAVEAERDALKADYERACKLVADMHMAAMGGVVGPVLGVVEDVAALKAELEAEREESKRWLAKAQNERDARNELEAELERIKALEPVAWRTFDGEGDYDYRTYDMNESYAEDYAKRNPNHTHWVEPLYAPGIKT